MEDYAKVEPETVEQVPGVFTSKLQIIYVTVKNKTTEILTGKWFRKKH